MIAIETVVARGHPNIKALHRTTFEITKDSYVTERGDCIVAVKANKSVSDFSVHFKNLVRRPSSIIIIVLEAEGVQEVVLARGHPGLKLIDERKIVVRKSTFLGIDTIGIEANKAARDLSRELIERLQNSETVLIAKFIVMDISRVLGVSKLW